MTDNDIRELVRSAIARHLGGQAAAPVHAPLAAPQSGSAAVSVSFHRYPLPRPPGESMCLIEPAVTCNHCGYCECHGH